MKRRVVAIVENKSFFLWSLRTAAGLVFLSVFPVLFILIDAVSGSLVERAAYVEQNYFYVQLGWGLTFSALSAVCFVFGLLLFHLNRRYRPLLQCGWFICVIALCAGALFHLIELLLMPLLMEWLLTVPTETATQMFTAWNQSLVHLGGVFIPVSMAIGGLIYTAVMFQTKEIPFVISIWSFGVWAMVLIGSLLTAFVGILVFFVLSAAILFYAPWMWQMGKIMKNS
jgi:MFS family permease